MNLPDGWSASFDDIQRRVRCRKYVANGNGTQTRNIHFAWMPPHIKAIDPASGTFRSDEIGKLPPNVKALVVAECQRRWA